MIKKIFNSALSLINGATKSNSTAPIPQIPANNGAMCNNQYPQGINHVDLNSSYGMHGQYPVNPYIQNPEVSYREIQQQQQFYAEQSRLQHEQLKRQVFENQALINLNNARAEYQAQMIANGADPSYYAKLNQAYNEGLRRGKH